MAAELAAQLNVSPAAISGAVRYLIQVGLTSREREPGSRRDVFRVHEDAWYDAAIRRGFAELRQWGTTSVANIEAFPELMTHLGPSPLRTWW